MTARLFNCEVRRHRFNFLPIMSATVAAGELSAAPGRCPSDPQWGEGWKPRKKWWRRYQAEGEAGLVDKSRRPHRVSAQKVFDEQEALIVSLRRQRRLGIRQLRNELIRQHNLRLSLDTIYRVLVRHNEHVLKRPRRRRKGARRSSGPGRSGPDGRLTGVRL